MIEKHNIDKLLLEIIENLDWGPIENWGNYDFDRLNELILEQTNTQLSSVTLKRVFGKIKYDSRPSIHTLNTLSQFRNYKDWRDFLSQSNKTTSPIPSHKPISSTPHIISKKVFSRRPFYGIGFGILAAVILFIAMSSKKSTILRPQDFKLDSVKIGKDIPSTVVFRYDASKANTESKIEIQQNWDKRRRTVIQSKDSIHTSIYYYPGFFEAKLIVDEKVVQEQPIFIPSNGWITAVEKSPTPMYVPTSISKIENTLGISPEFLKENNFHPQSETIWTNYTLVQKFPVFSNDFSFEALVKNAALGGVNVCQKIELVLLFEGDAMVVPLAKEGCVSNLRLYVPGTEMIGKTEDLSMFGVNGEEWIPLKINSSQEELSIFIADQKVKTLPLTIAPKRLIGFRFRFEGTGWVKDVHLNGEVIL